MESGLVSDVDTGQGAQGVRAVTPCGKPPNVVGFRSMSDIDLPRIEVAVERSNDLLLELVDELRRTNSLLMNLISAVQNSP